MKNIYKYIFTIIGTFVGAGFASGKEIYIFFYKYGIYGIIGIIFSCIIIAVILYKTMQITYNYGIKNYDEFLDIIFKNKIMKKIIKKIINLFFIACFCIMISGFCGFLKQKFNINLFISYSFIIIVCVTVILNKAGAVLEINRFLIPAIILLLAIIFFTFYETNNLKIKINEEKNNSNYYIISSILYSNYNLISLVPIAIVVGNSINKNNNDSELKIKINSKKIQNKIINNRKLNNKKIENKITNNKKINNEKKKSKMINNKRLNNLKIKNIISNDKIKNKKTYKYFYRKIAIRSTIYIFIIACMMLVFLNSGNENIYLSDMPMINIVKDIGNIYYYLYCFLIIGCIITTAISVGYGYLEKYENNKKNYLKNMLILIILSYIFCNISFSKLIETLYPLFGVVGCIQTIYIIKK